MFLKLKETSQRHTIWINLSHVKTAVIDGAKHQIKLTFFNKTMMIFDSEDVEDIAARLDSVSMGDPHDEILSLSEELLSDLSDPGTPGEAVINPDLSPF